jgi:hypothetical protein
LILGIVSLSLDELSLQSLERVGHELSDSDGYIDSQQFGEEFVTAEVKVDHKHNKELSLDQPEIN